MKNIYGMTRSALESTLREQGHKPYAARQIFDWLYKKMSRSFEDMTNISKTLRAALPGHFHLRGLTLKRRVCSRDGTKKYLFGLEDGHTVEAVLMQHPYGFSLCVSTQVGCNIGCSFCASGLLGRVRNLDASEMTLQVLEVMRLEDIRVSNVVVMGTGEPFDNFDETMAFIDIINDACGLAIGARRITVSTAGIVPGIDAFAAYDKQVNLAVSLHAPDDALRSRLMKINDVYPIADVVSAVVRYTEKTNRRATFEYILFDGLNDSNAHADALSDRLRGVHCYVNLIRYNPIPEFGYGQSGEERAVAFHHRLMDRGITATLRRERGGDIDAACGQLRAQGETKKKGGSV